MRSETTVLENVGEVSICVEKLSVLVLVEPISLQLTFTNESGE